MNTGQRAGMPVQPEQLLPHEVQVLRAQQERFAEEESTVRQALPVQPVQRTGRLEARIQQ